MHGLPHPQIPPPQFRNADGGADDSLLQSCHQPSFRFIDRRRGSVLLLGANQCCTSWSSLRAFAVVPNYNAGTLSNNPIPCLSNTSLPATPDGDSNQRQESNYLLRRTVAGSSSSTLTSFYDGRLTLDSCRSNTGSQS